MTYLPIDNSPDHAAALGRLIAHWGDLESQFRLLFQFLLKIDNMKAHFINQEFLSVPAKITFLRRINHFFTLDASSKHQIDELLKTIEGLNKQRNRFIHATWQYTIQDQLMRQQSSLPAGNHKKRSKPLAKFTSQDIQNVVQAIEQTSQSLQNLIIPLLVGLVVPL
ncbi:MAG: hypothetical protein WBW55_01405 [Desulfobaccales bacterium]